MFPLNIVRVDTWWSQGWSRGWSWGWGHGGAWLETVWIWNGVRVGLRRCYRVESGWNQDKVKGVESEMELMWSQVVELGVESGVELLLSQ